MLLGGWFMTEIAVCGFVLLLSVAGYVLFRVKMRQKCGGDAMKVMFAAGLLGMFLCITEQNDSRLTGDGKLRRGEAGGHSVSEELELNVDGILEDYDYTVELEPQQLSGEALEELFVAAGREAEEKFLRENTSPDHIDRNVSLPGQLQNGQIDAEWSFAPEGLIDGDGALHVDGLGDDGMVVNVFLTLSYHEESLTQSFGCHVYKRRPGVKEKLLDSLKENLEAEQERSRLQEYFSLPMQIDGYTLRWSKKKEGSYKIILLLGLIAAIVVYAQQDLQQRKVQQKRRERLLQQYPDMVSKLSLLLGAGMTLSGAWERIVTAYLSKLNHKRTEPTEVYEEMLVSYRELQDGIGELKVYERFGERCGMPQYRKLSTLLVQNLRKGSAGLNKLLEKEVEDAFALRKNHAKRAGEEAGTKMLVPMMLMLCIVMVIILVPAFLAFEI